MGAITKDRPGGIFVGRNLIDADIASEFNGIPHENQVGNHIGEGRREAMFPDCDGGVAPRLGELQVEAGELMF
jgi:hypothetical protein